MAFWNRKKAAAPKRSYLSVESVILEPDGDESWDLVGVVGESHYQSAISAICGRNGSESVRHGCIAALVANPTNEYDPNAIMVQIDANLVGHLSREDAIRYHPVVDAAARLGTVIGCNALIAARDPGEADTSNAGVFLSLPSPDQAAQELGQWSRERLGSGD